jgi:hypothetical protein
MKIPPHLVRRSTTSAHPAPEILQALPERDTVNCANVLLVAVAAGRNLSIAHVRQPDHSTIPDEVMRPAVEFAIPDRGEQ